MRRRRYTAAAARCKSACSLANARMTGDFLCRAPIHLPRQPFHNRFHFTLNNEKGWAQERNRQDQSVRRTNLTRRPVRPSLTFHRQLSRGYSTPVEQRQRSRRSSAFISLHVSRLSCVKKRARGDPEKRERSLLKNKLLNQMTLKNGMDVWRSGGP